MSFSVCAHESLIGLLRPLADDTASATVRVVFAIAPGVIIRLPLASGSLTRVIKRLGWARCVQVFCGRVRRVTVVA